MILALDSDDAGRKATAAIKEKLAAAGVAVRVASLPPGIKDANELLVSRNGDASEASAPGPRRRPSRARFSAATATARELRLFSLKRNVDGDAAAPPRRPRSSLQRDGLTYHARVQSTLLGRLRVTVKVERGELFHVDTLDLYASRSRSRVCAPRVEGLRRRRRRDRVGAPGAVVECEKAAERRRGRGRSRAAATMSESERDEALAFLRRGRICSTRWRRTSTPRLRRRGHEQAPPVPRGRLAQARRSALGDRARRRAGAGKSGLTEVIEKLTPPEDVVLFTRLTPQSLYYTEPGFLDQKLVIVEERYGSMEADYSIRVLQSRKKLIAAAPVKDPQTGNMRTKVFTVEARAAFIEATTASSVNHENATRCFELSMDESAEQTQRIHERQRLHEDRGRPRAAPRGRGASRAGTGTRSACSSRSPVVIPFADRLTFPTSLDADAARPRALPEPDRGLGLPAPAPARERRPARSWPPSPTTRSRTRSPAQVLTETLSDVKKPLREAYERIRELSLKGDGTVVAPRDPRGAGAAGLDGAALARRARRARVPGEAEARKGGAGKATRYRLVERGPQQDAGARPADARGPGRARQRMPQNPPLAKTRQTAVAGF